MTTQIDQLTRERDAWIETARQHARNKDFYRGIVRQIGEMFGEAARTSDDGSIQQDVLALKVPELVAAALLSARRERIRELEGERDTATRALAVLDKIAWLAAEEDSWFGNENDIAVQRAAAERHRAALSKTEGKG